MPDWPSIDEDPDTGEYQYTFNAAVMEALALLRSNFFGSARDTNTPLEGEINVGEDGSIKLRFGSVWVDIPSYKLFDDVDFDGFSPLNFILERLSGALTPSAGTIARVTFNNATARVEYVKSAAVKAVVAEVLATSLDDVPLPFLNGEVFAAVSPSVNVDFVVPAGWNGTSDLTLRLYVKLDGAEASGDDIEFTYDFSALLVGSEGRDKARQTLTGTEDIGAENAAETVHEVDITIPANSSPDVIFAGALVVGELYRTSVGGAGKVGSVTVLAARVTYPAGNYDR
ncbi:MAG: hypothetical protein ACHQ1G_00085 [Planctomycetota bacterium]